MCRLYAALVVLVVVISYSVPPVESGSLCEKIPKAFYQKLRTLCSQIEAFKACMVEKKACTKEEADKLEALLMKYKACPMPDGDDEMKTHLCTLGEIKEVVDELSKYTSKIGALMKCTKPKK